MVLNDSMFDISLRDLSEEEMGVYNDMFEEKTPDGDPKDNMAGKLSDYNLKLGDMTFEDSETDSRNDYSISLMNQAIPFSPFCQKYMIKNDLKGEVVEKLSDEKDIENCEPKERAFEVNETDFTKDDSTSLINLELLFSPINQKYMLNCELKDKVVEKLRYQSDLDEEKMELNTREMNEAADSPRNNSISLMNYQELLYSPIYQKSMSNYGYQYDSAYCSAYPDLSNGHPSPSPDLWKEGRPVPTPPKKKPGPVKSTYKKTKYALKSNPYTNPFFPPNGEVATTLTLILTIVAIFFTARTVLGPIADVGGTIFALLMLILLALIGGKLILGATWLLQKFCKVDIRLPPLLGMLIVGIILKNVPYNFGQFGRAECTVDSHGVHHNASGQFLDSIHGDTDDHKGSFRRRRDVSEDHFDIDEFVDDVLVRVERSVSIGGDSHETKHEEDEDDCHPKYIGHDLDPTISRTLRSICLAVILLMAGLELDPVALMKLSAMVIRATFIPCFTEALVVAVLSNLILGLPWTVGFMLGFVLAAVSPAVIIPSLMSLSQRGYGVAKGIPTLVIAACSADDVVAISGFGIFFGLTFSAGAPLWKLILHGPIEVAIGVGFGVFWGILAQWIPNKEHHHVVFFRWLILLGGGLIAIFGAQLFHYDGAGGLATIILAFVAGMEWRKEGWGDHNPVMKTFKRMWIILEPIIFALIGTEIQVDKIDFQVLGYSILVLFGALVIRMIGTYFSVTCGTLNTKEKIFMAFAWLPKATVQAALGPIFLDSVLKLSDDHWKSITEDICKVWNNGTNYALNNGVSVASDFVGWVNSTDLSTWVNGTEIEPNCIYSIEGDWEATKMIWTDWGNNILTLAVLSILITAPLGAISILALGPKLLESNKDEDGVPHSSDEESSH